MNNPSPCDSGYDSSFSTASGPGQSPSSRSNSDIDDQVAVTNALPPSSTPPLTTPTPTTSYNRTPPQSQPHYHPTLPTFEPNALSQITTAPSQNITSPITTTQTPTNHPLSYQTATRTSTTQLMRTYPSPSPAPPVRRRPNHQHTPNKHARNPASCASTYRRRTEHSVSTIHVSPQLLRTHPHCAQIPYNLRLPHRHS